MSKSISIVTPSYGMADFLAETIDSVLSNVRPGDEYFVIDGGSTDGSAEIIRGRQDDLSGWVSEPDDGYAHALSKGFSKSTGDILCWINVGDRLASGALDAVRHRFSESRADIIFGDDFYFDEQGCVISYSRGYVNNLGDAMLYGGWTPLQDACFWRRSLYEKVGGIDPEIKYAADYDLFLRMSLQGESEYVPMVFSGFRRHPGQKSIAGSTDYKREREHVRKRELARAASSRWGKTIRSIWYSAAVRWRVHVAQRRWVRPDLVGLPVADLACGEYWPGPTLKR